MLCKACCVSCMLVLYYVLENTQSIHIYIIYVGVIIKQAREREKMKLLCVVEWSLFLLLSI